MAKAALKRNTDTGRNARHQARMERKKQ
ncbi:MAG: hypothetical protein ABGX03_04460 [Methylophilaceae bacterium]